MCLFAINTGLLCNFVGFDNKAINGAQLNGESLFFRAVFLMLQIYLNRLKQNR